MRPLEAGATLLPPAGTPLPGRSHGPLGSSQGAGNIGGSLHPGAHVRTGCSGRRRLAAARIPYRRKDLLGFSGVGPGVAEARRPVACEVAAAGRGLK